MNSLASTCRDFNRSVNMTPGEIRAWARDSRALEASWSSTRRRLPALAALKAKACSTWTAGDARYARRVLNFNSRMGGMAKKWGCTRKLVVALRNWGHQPPQCAVPGAK